MKKILNIALIVSFLAVSSNVAFAKKVKTPKKAQAQQQMTVDETKIAKKNNNDPVQIVKPEKTKVNKKLEARKAKVHEQTKEDSSKEAEGMYETKFPTIDSKINFFDKVDNLPTGISLDDCIKLAITHHPTIISAIQNSEIYKTRIGQAWSNYFPTFSAGVSYSRNDMLMTMGGAMTRMIPQKYNMYYVPNLSADMLLFDFGKTKANADNATKTYEASRYDAETGIENVIYNVKVAYYNLVFAKIQKEVYKETVKDYESVIKTGKSLL